MALSGRSAGLVRLLQMVEVLKASRWTRAQLAQEFQVHGRTVLRDLAILTRVGLPLTCERHPGHATRYSLPLTAAPSVVEGPR